MDATRNGPEQGSIVWIEVDDPRGNTKRRPVVIVTPTSEILKNQEIVGVAVTTTFRVPLEDHCIKLPSSSFGHPATGLRRESVVVCNWLVRFRPSEISSIEGYVPGHTLLKIIEKVGELDREA